MIGSTVPRRLMTPHTKPGAWATGVAGVQTRISRTTMTSTAELLMADQESDHFAHGARSAADLVDDMHFGSAPSLPSRSELDSNLRPLPLAEPWSQRPADFAGIQPFALRASALRRRRRIWPGARALTRRRRLGGRSRPRRRFGDPCGAAFFTRRARPLGFIAAELELGARQAAGFLQHRRGLLPKPLPPSRRSVASPGPSA